MFSLLLVDHLRPRCRKIPATLKSSWDHAIVEQRQYVTQTMTTNGKQASEQTLARHIALLDRLPAGLAPAHGRTVGELVEFLNASAFVCGRRTVERDLEAIDAVGSVWRSIGVDLQHGKDQDDARLVRWSHTARSKALLFQTLSNEEALLLSLVEQELRFFMPASAHQSLMHYLKVSNRVLSLHANQRQAQFRERVRVIADGPALRPPELNMPHLHEINEALLNEEQVDLAYRPARSDADVSYRLHPVGLVKQGLFFYLLAVKDSNVTSRAVPGPVQTFRVDRIRQVTRRRQEVVAKGLPGLDEALGNGQLRFFDKGEIALTLCFAQNAEGQALCDIYRETPMAPDQRILTLADGSMELQATVMYSLQLVRMLQAEAHRSRVLQPTALKNEIVAFVKAAAGLHL
jgi:predicted DNA-binding transcriptional regulator YafY